MAEPAPTSGPSAPSLFATTQWTRVLASRGDEPAARDALAALCADYYPPVVTFLRQEHRDEDAARELAHAFFANLLERHALAGADPARGRFRSYLLGALKHFLANQRARAHREKRGGGREPLPLGSETDTDTHADGAPHGPSAPGTPPPPDAVFDRAWALSVLDRALSVLERECREAGPEAARQFEQLKPWLTGDPVDRTQGEVARELGQAGGAVRVAIHRLRRRYRDLVKSDIARTVADPADTAEELRHLIAVVAHPQ